MQKLLQMTHKIFDIYVPLNNFWSSESHFELAPGLVIQKLDKEPDLSNWWDYLGQLDKDAILPAGHWLTFQWQESSTPNPGEQVNLALLALWLVKPNKIHATSIFRLTTDGSIDKEMFTRLIDIFTWSKGTPNNQFTKEELETASKYYSRMLIIYNNKGRLNDALILTLAGCWAHYWQAALITYAAAAETLLTYSTAHGLTRRLASSYACLVCRTKKQRDAAFNNFRTLYRIRSDLVHGRAHTVAKSTRLKHLQELADLLRKLWRRVLLSKRVTKALEGSDSQRDSYFRTISAGYQPPP